MAESGVIESSEVKKKGGGKAPKTRKKRDPALHPPRANYKVEKCEVKGYSVTCTYTPRTPFKKSVTDEFMCSSEAHAELLAEHAPRIHARWRLSGLRYTLKKYARGSEGYELLNKARRRAATRKVYRKKISEEKARMRRAQELALQKKKEATK